MRRLFSLIAFVFAATQLSAMNATVREVRYDGKLSDNEARFVAELDLEVTGKGEAVVPLFDGDVAVLTTKFPEGLTLERKGPAYTLVITKEGRHKLKLDLLAKITKAEPWNQIAFNGPIAAIASVKAQAAGDGARGATGAVEVQLLKGTVSESGPARVAGFLGTEQSVAIRWQSKIAEITRKALLTCDSSVTVQITPTVVKYNTALKYEILQGNVTRLQISLPANQALTKLQGENVRDWQVRSAEAAGRVASPTRPPGEGSGRDGVSSLPTTEQVLSVEFVRPVEKSYVLTLFSEQTVESASASVNVAPPQPLEVEREAGAMTVSAEDVLVETEKADGLRQVNAAAGALAAYQFHARPIALALKLRRIEPLINVVDRVTTRLEEARLLVTHALTLTIEKAGIYTLELAPQQGFVVADVRGDGVEDWKSSGGKLTVTFASRVLSKRTLDVQLERAFRTVGRVPPRSGAGPAPAEVSGPTFPERITIAPLRVTGAAKETGQVGAAAVAGIQIKTAADGLAGLREIPINSLANRTDEVLAYNAEQADWKLTLTAERLAARITADIFNLVTVGDGIVGGSATIRYAILNQGVQEFRVKLPALWKNIDFTGPNIRRKEQQGDEWVIGLQEKAWGGYTLVVTYDMQFDPHKAALPVGGIHCAGVERETGSIAVTSAANLQIAEGKKSAGVEASGVVRGSPDPAQGTGGAVGRPAPNDVGMTATIRRVDEGELAAHDRALITRPVLLAYQYTGDAYEVITEVTRFDELPVLEAVADRTQLTTVVTEDGQTLTQASFLVKNNDKQFQSFTLPAGAEFWSCYVRGEPAKPERSGDKLLVPLPRGANRDEAFAVDIVYKKSVGSLKTLWRDIELSAPVTDMQTTYAEWELFVPTATRLASFGGNMIAARGTTYSLRDAWREFIRFYDNFVSEYFPAMIACAVLFVLAFLMAAAFRRGWRGALAVVGVVAVFVLLAGMLMPVLMSSRRASEMRRTQVLSETEAARRDGGGTSGEGGRAGKEVTEEKLVELKVKVPKPMFVGTPLPVKVPNMERANESEDLRSRAAREGVIVLGGGNRYTGGTVINGGTLQQGVGGVLGGYATYGGTYVAGGLLRPAAPPTPAAPPAEVAARTDFGRTDLGLVADYSRVTAASVAGLRPIRIEIPKAGTRFVFTKVLNVRSEPLSVSAMALDNDVFKIARGIGQALVFVAGLALLGWQWRTTRRRSLLIALGIALAVGGVGALLLSARVLDAALILAAPLIGLVVLGWLTRKAWRAIPAKTVAGTATATPPPVISLLTLALIGAASVQAAPMEKVTILSASYTGVVTETTPPAAGQAAPAETRGVAQFEAVLELSATETNQTVRLFGEDVAVQEFSGPKAEVKRGWCSWFSRKETTEARLVRDGKSVGVLLPDKGTASVRLKFLVKVGGDVTKRKLEFGIPPALVSRLAVTLEEPQAVVELPTAVSFKTTNLSESGRGLGAPTLPGRGAEAAPTLSGKTRVEAVIGSGEKVDLSWTPRMKKAGEIAATVFCQNTSLVTFGGGVVNTRSTLDFNVTQGELRQMQVKLPVGHRLMRVEGEGIRTWKLDAEPGRGAEAAPTLVSVELLKGVSPAYRLTVETERSLETAVVRGSPDRALGGTEGLPKRTEDLAVGADGAVGRPAPNNLIAVQVPHAENVKRETGLIGVKASDELSVTVESATELQKVDVEEFARATGGLISKGTGETPVQLSSAYRFLKPAFELKARVEAVQPQIEAAVRNQIRVGTEQISLSATVEYTIKRTGVFTLRLALPPEYRVERVTGQNIAQHVEKKDGRGAEAAPTLEVTLKQRTMGAYTLQVNLRRTLTELPKKLELTGVRPLDVQKLTGFVSASSEEGVQLRSEGFDGLTEVPSAMVAEWAGRSGNALAFKLLPAETGVTAWKLTVTTERIDSWVRAEVMNWATVTETLLSGRSLVRYEIQNAPTKELRLKVPAAWRNVEILGANIRRKDEQNGEWRVELQNKVRGTIMLTVTWERPWNVKEGLFDLPGVEALGVERENGTIAVLARPPLKVESKEMSVELLKIDRRELPDWAEAAGQTPTLAFRYLRPGYKLSLAAQRFEEAEVLQALVDNVTLTTVVSEDGQMMTEMSLAIRNNARQYLEVTLPANATNVWAAFVAGQPVRPSVRGGKLLVPLERSGADGAAIAVELIFIGGDKFPRTRGTVDLASPALDVPFKNGRWDLYLPPEYNYSRFDGTMKRELLAVVAKATKPVVELFSLGDYTVTEQRNKAWRESELQSSISNVRAQLKSGKLNEAAQNWNRYRGNNEIVSDELKQLDKDVRQAQGNQLIEAQKLFMIGNSAVPQAPQTLQAPREYTLHTARQPKPQQQVAQQVQVTQWGMIDADAAEQQADKVAKAQEITVAKALPLRVNLPKRGVHLTFTQTLQTEVRKPMTLQFLAAESKGLGVTATVGLALAGFGALWALVGLVRRRK